MFYLFYRIYGHFVFRSPQPPPWGRTTGAVRPEDYPHREGCVRDKWEAQKPTTALASGLNRRILAWSGKRTLCRRSVKKRGRFACKPAKAPVLAMPNNVPAKATCGWFWRYLLTPKGSYTPRQPPRFCLPDGQKAPTAPAVRTARRQAIRKKNLALRPACTIFGSALYRRRLGKLQTSLHLRPSCTIFVFIL